MVEVHNVGRVQPVDCNGCIVEHCMMQVRMVLDHVVRHYHRLGSWDKIVDPRQLGI
jgi:hypothetical protein